MAKPKRRWGITIVLGIATVAFIVLSLAPLLSALTSPSFQNQARELSPAQLEAEADGLEAVLEREPDNIVALRGLVQTRLELNQVEAAIAPLEALVAQQPGDTQLALLLGRLQLQVGDAAGAAATLADLYDDNPSDPAVLEALVQAELSSGNATAAIARLETRLEAQPQETQTALLLAEAYTLGQRPDEALALYDELIDRDPGDFRPLIGKAIILSGRADDEGAIAMAQDLFEQAEAQAPEQIQPQIREIARVYGSPADSPELEVTDPDLSDPEASEVTPE